MKHEGPDIIHCFREDGSTRCTSYHGDECWDTPENRHLTFEFITKAQDALRVAATLLKGIKIDADHAVATGLVSPMTEHTEGQLQSWLDSPVVKSVQR